MVVISQGNLIVIFCAFAVNLSMNGGQCIQYATGISDEAHHQRHLPSRRPPQHLHHHLQNLLRVYGHPSTTGMYAACLPFLCHVE